MLANWKCGAGSHAIVFAATAPRPTGASAFRAEVAKKCNALLAKEFPTPQPGNPAVGSAKGSGKAAPYSLVPTNAGSFIAQLETSRLVAMEAEARSAGHSPPYGTPHGRLRI